MNDNDQTLDPTQVPEPSAGSELPVTDEPIRLDESGGVARSVGTEKPASEIPVAPVLPMSPHGIPVAPANGEDLPLGFATAVAGNSGFAGSQTASPLPPVAPAPLPAIEPQKPKGGGFSIKKVLVVFVGLAILGSIVAGAWYAYLNYAGEEARIAAVKAPAAKKPPKDVTNKNDCYGCYNGGWLVWRDGQCKVTGICDSGVPGKDTENPSTPPPGQENEKAPPSGCNSSSAQTCCGAGYVFCGGQINKCVSNAAIAANGGGCNTYGERVYGIPTTFGASAFEGNCEASKVSSGLQTQCNCGRGNVCFNTRGVCFLGKDNNETVVVSDYANGNNPNNVTRSNGEIVNMGLCGLVSSYNPTTSSIKVNEDFFKLGSDCFDCKVDSNGVTTGCALKSTCDNNTCTLVHYDCLGTRTGASCTSNEKLLGQHGFNGDFFGRCGTVEQLDLMCNGEYISSRTRINPPCASSSPTSTPSPSPGFSLACRSLTKDKSDAQISIGTVVTLTCSGTVTPAGATSLSYSFRYNINGGRWTPLINKTPTTAELVPDQCGRYTAQCRVCGTIVDILGNTQLVCDPNWIAAGTQ